LRFSIGSDANSRPTGQASNQREDIMGTNFVSDKSRLRHCLAALALLVVASVGAHAATAPAELHVLLGVDPSDEGQGVELNPTLAPALSMQRTTGMRTTITRTGNMGDAMRASRTVENEVLIGPAHVTASAILHAYTLVGVSGQEQTYALVALTGIDNISQLPGKRLYLPQQDSLRSYVAKGLLLESGIKLTQLGKVTYGNTSAGGLLALLLGMADATIADEAQAREWVKQNPGKGSILKLTRPVPGGSNLLVRRDLCAVDCPKLTAWINSPEGSIPGTGRFQVAGAKARDSFTYVAALGITTPDSVTGAETVGADQVVQLARSGATVVDTRSAKEYDSERIKGAINLPYVERSLKETDFDVTKDDFTALAKLGKDTPIVFLCNGPECWKSYKASRVALSAGYKKIYWFRGGMPEWREKQMPVEGAATMAFAPSGTKSP
jgi:rhodanese-related sulfurtransferase